MKNLDFTMKAMILNNLTSLKEKSEPLSLVEIPIPKPKKGEVLIKVSACGVCHTEIDEIEGRIPPAKFPIILGHQVVGRIVENGEGSQKYNPDDRVGVAWIYSACGKCSFCQEGNENLCDDFLATGRDVDGGYAEYMIAKEDFIFPIPKVFSDAEAAPLLCAGAVGYRSLRLTGLKNGQHLGLTGFGASGHLVLKMAKFKFPDSKIYVFARNPKERQFALKLGADWAGDTTQRAPQKLHGIIDTTPVWKPVVEALANLEKSGRLVINSIRKEDNDKEYLLHLSYPDHLWMEKELKTVANVTSRDVSEFLKLADRAGIKPEVKEFKLKDANIALQELKSQKIRGAKVIVF